MDFTARDRKILYLNHDASMVYVFAPVNSFRIRVCVSRQCAYVRVYSRISLQS